MLSFLLAQKLFRALLTSDRFINRVSCMVGPGLSVTRPSRQICTHYVKPMCPTGRGSSTTPGTGSRTLSKTNSPDVKMRLMSTLNRRRGSAKVTTKANLLHGVRWVVPNPWGSLELLSVARKGHWTFRQYDLMLVLKWNKGRITRLKSGIHSSI